MGETIHHIICGYSGIGKSTAEQRHKNVYDFESSIFSHKWSAEEGTISRDESFPINYIDAIENHMNEHGVSVYLLSCHQEVRSELQSRGIPYIIVMPEPSLKEEYIRRWLKRGSSMEFIESMSERWDDMIASCEADPAPKIHLKQGEYINDVLPM